MDNALELEQNAPVRKLDLVLQVGIEPRRIALIVVSTAVETELLVGLLGMLARNEQRFVDEGELAQQGEMSKKYTIAVTEVTHARRVSECIEPDDPEDLEAEIPWQHHLTKSDHSIRMVGLETNPVLFDMVEIRINHFNAGVGEDGTGIGFKLCDTLLQVVRRQEIVVSLPFEVVA